MSSLSKYAVSRRKFVRRMIGAAGVVLPATIILPGCGEKKKPAENVETAIASVTDCRDLSAVSKEDLAIREKLAYVNESPVPDSECANCNLYLPPGEGKKCGGCMLFKGPVEAKGYCTYWAPKI